MIRPAIKWIWPLLAALTLSACAGRGLERYPPAIDHDRLQTRMATLRAYEREQERRRMQRRLQYVDLDPTGIQANPASRARLDALRERRRAAQAHREAIFREAAAAAEREIGSGARADRSVEYERLLALIARAEARIQRQRELQRARAAEAIERANRIAQQRQQAQARIRAAAQ